MKFLLDMPMPQRTALWLRAAGHDAIHARDIGLAQATDEEVLERAAQDGRIVLTMDLDFPHLLSDLPAASGPGVILVRLRYPEALTIQQRLQALFRMATETELAHAIVVLEESRIRVHRLPIR